MQKYTGGGGRFEVLVPTFKEVKVSREVRCYLLDAAAGEPVTLGK